MNSSPLAIRKLIVGVLALICLTTAVGLWLFSDDAGKNPLTAVTTRLGIILAALWLALPNQGETLAWGKVLPVGLVIIVACVRGGKVLMYAIPIALVVGIIATFIRPGPKRRPPKY
jgi:hypothetical protein